MRKLLIGLAIVLTSCAGQVDLGRAVQQLQRPSASSPAAAAADATAEAVKQVIETVHSSSIFESMRMRRSTRVLRPRLYSRRAPSGRTSAELSRRGPPRG